MGAAAAAAVISVAEAKELAEVEGQRPEAAQRGEAGQLQGQVVGRGDNAKTQQGG